MKPYTKKEVLELLELWMMQLEAQVSTVDLEAESGFFWLPFDKLEFQFYNIRDIQHHNHELCKR